MAVYSSKRKRNVVRVQRRKIPFMIIRSAIFVIKTGSLAAMRSQPFRSEFSIFNLCTVALLWKFVDDSDEVFSLIDCGLEGGVSKSYSIGFRNDTLCPFCHLLDKRRKWGVIVQQKFLGKGCLFRTDRHHNYGGFATTILFDTPVQDQKNSSTSRLNVSWMFTILTQGWEKSLTLHRLTIQYVENEGLYRSVSLGCLFGLRKYHRGIRTSCWSGRRCKFHPKSLLNLWCVYVNPDKLNFTT
jgi:hypothetical protein